MSLYSCVRCWETTCECGYKHRNWDIARLESLIKALQALVDEKQEESNAGDRA